MRNIGSDISDLLKVLRKQRTLYFRAFLCRSNKEFLVQALRVDNFSPLGDKEGKFLDYGNTVFSFGKVSGSEVAHWLETGTVLFEKRKYIIPEFQTNVLVDRYPSEINLHWVNPSSPFSVYRLSHSERDNIRDDYSPLVAEGNPSFPNLSVATYFFIYDKKYQSGNNLPSGLNFYIAQEDCWLGKIHLRPSSVKVEVNGCRVKDKRLELWTEVKHYEAQLKKRGSKSFSFPHGLPEKIWFALTKGNEWFDYRELDLKSSYLSNRKDITLTQTTKKTEIKGIIARGEGETTEFKEEMPPVNKTSQITKTVAAFANGDGGMIIIGVNDDGLIVGIKGNPDQENIRLSQIIRNNVVPQPKLQIEVLKIDGKSIITVRVEAGENLPYGIDSVNTKYYVRRGANSFPAKPEEVREISRRDLRSKENDSFTW